MAPPLPLRLIAFDRPGYGNSDPNPNAKSLQDLTGDVARLVSHLGLKRYAVVGVSGGGPLAAACARFLPEVSALTLISAVPPPEGVSDGKIASLMRFGRWPIAARPVMAVAREFILSPDKADTAVFGRVIPGRDGVVMNSTRRAALLAGIREGVRKGTAGAVADASFYGRPWGFRLEDILVPTAVWHGTEDHLIPAEAALAFKSIPNVTLNILPQEGHYSLALGQTEKILADLMARSAESLGEAANPG